MTTKVDVDDGLLFNLLSDIIWNLEPFFSVALLSCLDEWEVITHGGSSSFCAVARASFPRSLVLSIDSKVLYVVVCCWLKCLLIELISWFDYYLYDLTIVFMKPTSF